MSDVRPVPPPQPSPPTPRPPHPQRQPKRRIEFRAAGPVGDVAKLTQRLTEEGISFDRIPKADHVVVRAIADPERQGRPGLPRDLVRGLGSVEVTSDEVDEGTG